MSDVSDSCLVPRTAECQDFTTQRDDRPEQCASSTAAGRIESPIFAAFACAYSADSARADAHQFDVLRGRDNREDEPVHFQE